MTASSRIDPSDDPLLRDVPLIEGFRVLTPVVLYARLGQGGMGAVYRGRHLKFDLDVAVKCLKPALAEESEEFVLRFAREARLAAAINHQNLVSVKDVDFRHGLHYLVMEYVAGENARQRVLRKGALAEREALAILLGATAGLAAAHKAGVVHRDIKPDNILIAMTGEVKLSDLGLAKAAATKESMTITRGVMGTPQYMAPEQWEDMSRAGAPADVWALGATLYFLLTGTEGIASGSVAQMADRTRHQDFPDPRALRPDLSAPTCALLHRCVARDPAARYADARELLRALQPLVPDAEGALDGERGFAPTVVQPLVSPPPRATLARIRSAIGLPTPVSASAEAAAAAPGDAAPDATVDDAAPVATPTTGASAGGLGKLLALCGKLLTALAILLAIGWPLGLKDLVTQQITAWFRDDPDPGRRTGVRVEWLTAPRITVEQPAAGATVTPRVLFTGVVTGMDPLQLTIGGIKAPLDKGRFATAIGLRMGPQDVELVAVDGAGRRTVIQHRITVKAAPGAENPANPNRYLLTWANPEPGTDWVPAEGVAYPRHVRDPRADLRFVLVPEGSFAMGSPTGQGEADEHPRHTVRITRPFYLARCEVTIGQWRRFAEATGYRTGAETSGLAENWRSPWPRTGVELTDQHPVTQVSWEDAMAFCRHHGYRLPTEAEFEYANRAGSSGRFAWGDDPAQGRGQANVADELAPPDDTPPGKFPFRDGHAFLAPVGSFAANAFGLHDLTGNANEWCADWYDAQFYATPAGRADDPINRTENTFHVTRGGSMWSGQAWARVARRTKDVPAGHSPDLGFRPAHDP